MQTHAAENFRGPMAVSDSGPARRRRFLVGGVGGAACLCAAVAAISLRRSAPFEALAAGPTAKYGLRQPAERRAADGRLETRLRVVVGRDAYGVLARRYEGGTPGPTLRVSPGDRVAITVENLCGIPTDSRYLQLECSGTNFWGLSL